MQDHVVTLPNGVTVSGVYPGKKVTHGGKEKEHLYTTRNGNAVWNHRFETKTLAEEARAKYIERNTPIPTPNFDVDRQDKRVQDLMLRHDAVEAAMTREADGSLFVSLDTGDRYRIAPNGDDFDEVL